MRGPRVHFQGPVHDLVSHSCSDFNLEAKAGICVGRGLQGVHKADLAGLEAQALSNQLLDSEGLHVLRELKMQLLPVWKIDEDVSLLAVALDIRMKAVMDTVQQHLLRILIQIQCTQHAFKLQFLKA